MIEARQLEKYKLPDFIFSILTVIGIFLNLLQDIWRLRDPEFMLINYFGQQSISHSDELWTSIILFSAFLILFVGQKFPKLNPLYRRKIAKDYQTNFVKQELKQICISSTGINITSKNVRESRQWNSFNKIAENKKIFLLYHSRNKEATIIPKRIFDDKTQLDYFRELANSSKKQLDYK
ncbi:MAG: YcxB family protein [Cyanobacteria bacterium P01_A01_bin.83]